MTINCSDVATGETDGWIYPDLGFCQEILWMENMVDENRGKAIEGFCKRTIIMICHLILTGKESSGVGKNQKENR